MKRQFGPRAEFGPKTDSDQMYKFGANLYIRTKFIYSDQGLQANYRGNLVRIWLWSEFVFWSESVFGPNCRRAKITLVTTDVRIEMGNTVLEHCFLETSRRDFLDSSTRKKKVGFPIFAG